MSTTSRAPSSGLVLAGGRSVRFGGEKAVALLDGRPLLMWAAERLRTRLRERGDQRAARNRGGGRRANARNADALRCARRCRGPARRCEGRFDLGRRAGRTARSPSARAMHRSCPTISTFDCSSAPRAARRWPRPATAASRCVLCGRSRRCRWFATALAGGAHPPTWQVLERLGARKVSFERPERSRTSIRATTWPPSRRGTGTFRNDGALRAM